jgi:hypothetical protein
VLYSIQKYVQGQLNGLAMPDPVPGPLVAWITPPVWERLNAPRAYVWGATLNAARQTAPRGPGMKKFPWAVDVYLVYLDTPDDARNNEGFALVIDTIMTQFMTTVMPLWIDNQGSPAGPNASAPTDTQIQAIGENFSLRYPPEKLASYQRMVWYSAVLSIDVLEVLQA